MTAPSTPRPELRCRRCRYLLDATEPGVCPECGRPFDPDDPKTVRKVPPEPEPTARFTCPSCGYDQRANIHGVCTECGAAVRAVDRPRGEGPRETGWIRRLLGRLRR